MLETTVVTVIVDMVTVVAHVTAFLKKDEKHVLVHNFVHVVAIAFIYVIEVVVA